MNNAFWRGKRVLVTGHSGFKGSWLSIWLSQLDAEVSGIALPPQTEPSLYSCANIENLINSQFVDIRESDALAAMLSKTAPQIVFHLAAQAIVADSYEDPRDTYTTNVIGTLNVLEACHRCDSVEAVIVVTSDKCYDNQESGHRYKETDPLGGHDPYSSSKACAEIVTASFRNSFCLESSQMKVASARAGNVIGGGDWSPQRLIPDVVRAVTCDEPLVIRRPRSVRPWQHVLEPLHGYLLLAEHLFEDRGYAEAWNFGPAENDEREVGWILNYLIEHWDISSDVVQILDEGDSFHEAGLLNLNSSKAEQRLGWVPNWSLDKTLDSIVDWHRQERAGNPMLTVCAEQIAQFEREWHDRQE